MGSDESLEILVDARCQEHPRRSIGVVLLTPGGFPSWETRHEGRPFSVRPDPWNRHSNTLFVNLRDPGLTEVQGWCRDCRKARSVSVADLLAAVASNRRPVVLAWVQPGH